MMIKPTRTNRILLVSALGILSITCSGDQLTRPAEKTGEFAVAGPPARITISRQPPSSALDQEVWAPGSQPVVVVKDAAGVAVRRCGGNRDIASGSGVIQGARQRHHQGQRLGHLCRSGDRRDAAITRCASQSARSGRPPQPSRSIRSPAKPEPGSGTRRFRGTSFRSTSSCSPPASCWPGAGAKPTAAWDAPAVGSGGWSARHGYDRPGRRHAVLRRAHADGRWASMVSGGHLNDDRGLDVTNIFDPVSESWATGLPKMAKGRWYPTVTRWPTGGWLRWPAGTPTPAWCCFRRSGRGTAG